MPSSKSPAKKLEIKSEVCDVCRQTVYQVEEVKHLALVVHRACFKCCRCQRPLQMGHIATRDHSLFCHACFRKAFASKGYDFGAGSLQLEVRAACGGGGGRSLGEIAPKVAPAEDYGSVVLRSVGARNGERAQIR